MAVDHLVDRTGSAELPLDETSLAAHLDRGEFFWLDLQRPSAAELDTKQLTVIATIFLPLTFVTGFFGQNFGWMVDHVDSWPAFLALGIGLQLATVVLLFAYFKRQGWF